MALQKDFTSGDDQMYIGKDWYYVITLTPAGGGAFRDLTNKSFFGTAVANLDNTIIPDNANVNADQAFSIRWKAGTAGKLADGTTINQDGGTSNDAAGTYETTGIYYGYIYVKAETLGQLVVSTTTSSTLLTSPQAKLTYKYEIVERDTSKTMFDFEGTPTLTYTTQTTVTLTKDQLVQYGQDVYRASEDFSGTGTEFLVALNDVAQFAPVDTIPGTIITAMYGKISIQTRVAHRTSSSQL